LAILDHAGDVVNAVGPRGTTALLVACEYRREAIARALLDRGAKIDALKTRLNSESATTLAKIGTEKGIMLFGIKRDQKEADFRKLRLGPGDAILISSDLVKGSLTSVDLSANHLTTYGMDMTGIKELAAALGVNSALTVANLLGNQLDVESAKLLAEVAKQKGISLCGIRRDQSTADFAIQGLGPGDAILISSDLVRGALTQLDLSGNQLCGKDHLGFGTHTAEGITAIADTMRINGGLTALDLSHNCLEDEGVSAVCKAIQNNKDTKLALRVNGSLTRVPPLEITDTP